MSVPVDRFTVKALPTDFLVRENIVLDQIDSDQSDYHYVLLRKCGLTTMEAVRVIANTFGIQPKNVTYCGLKDEDGITEQLLALPANVIPPAAHKPIFSAFVGPHRWLHLIHYGFGAKPLTVGVLAGNSFGVIVRNVDEPTAKAFAAQTPINLVFLNYYDIQRFGMAEKPKLNHHIGDAIIAQDWATALELIANSGTPESATAAMWADPPERFFLEQDRRLIDFYLASSSSFCFNRLLSELVAADMANLRLTSEGFTFCFLPSSRHVIELMSKHPMISYTRFSFSEGKLVARLLSRPSSIQSLVHVTEIANDGLTPRKFMVRLSFTLPAGSYATMALRQLVHFQAN